MTDVPEPPKPDRSDRLVIRSDLAELGRLTDFIDRFCDGAGVAEQTRFRLTLIAEELVTNVIVHGYGAGAEGAVEIGLRRRDGVRVELRVADSAAPFDPLSQPPADLAPEIEARTVGGLGVHIARSMAEQLEYRRSRGRNVVRALVRMT